MASPVVLVADLFDDVFVETVGVEASEDSALEVAAHVLDSGVVASSTDAAAEQDAEVLAVPLDADFVLEVSE